jgi:hypothetical protein
MSITYRLCDLLFEGEAEVREEMMRKLLLRVLRAFLSHDRFNRL